MRYESESGEPLEEADIDLNLGWVREERRLVAHHEATPEVPERSHWEEIAVDGSGFSASSKVIDVPYQPAREAWDEYETVGVYHPYTDEELEAQAAERAEADRAEAVSEQAPLAVMMLVNAQASAMSDEAAASMPALFDGWTVGTDYKMGDVVRWKGGLWRALQDGTAQDIYPPDGFVAGWKRIGEPDASGVFTWSQPLGATDAYMKGDKVTHKDSLWVSDVDWNVWEPGVYGWTKDSGGTSAPETGGDDEGWPAFVQPTGAHDAYGKGAKVTFEGKRYVSLIDGNVWSPADNPSGWSEVADAVDGGE